MNELARLIERFERWTGLDLRRGSSFTALERYLQAQLPADDPTALARFVEELTSPHHPEAVRLIDAITVCHTSFYRDPEQLAAVTAVLAAHSSPSREAAVWVPACATGEDPYSIALIAESLKRPVTILGTDINTRALAHAGEGIYGPWSVRDLPPSLALPQRADGRYEIPERLRRVVSFARHNLMDVPPLSPGGWDIIVCRNVLMYISRERIQDVIQRLAAALRPGGYLFVGANDIFERAPAPLRFVRIGQRHVLWLPPAAPPGATAPPSPSAGALVSAIMAAVAPPADTPSSPPPLLARPSSSSPPPLARSSSPSSPPPPLARPSSPSSPPPPMARPSSSPARAHALLLEGDTAAALEMVLAVLEADPLCVEARLIAGIAYQLTGDALQATTALRAALVLAPDLWPAETYLGFALRQLGDEANAKRALRRGAQLAEAAGRLPLSPSVATWFEGWRVDVIEMGRRS